MLPMPTRDRKFDANNVMPVFAAAHLNRNARVSINGINSINTGVTRTNTFDTPKVR